MSIVENQAASLKKNIDLRHNTLLKLLKLFFKIENERNIFYRNFNISTQKYNLLRILRGSHPIALTVNDIRQRMLDKNSDITRLVEKLQTLGFVENNIDALDKHIHRISITSVGLELLSEIEKTHSQLWEFKTLNEEEVSQLNGLVEKLLDN